MKALLLFGTLIFGLTSCGGSIEKPTKESKEEPKEVEIKYASVKIGTQEWMETNLDVDKFKNGDEIPQAKTKDEWKKAAKEGTPAWCYYGNEATYNYGKLYNWQVLIDERGLAPKGWNVPSDEEWSVLEDFLGSKVGKKLKSDSNWKSDGNGDNSSGFNALPSGVRVDDGNFNLVGMLGYWWSATEKDEKTTWVRGLSYDSDEIWRGGFPKNAGFSVRCVKEAK